MKKILLLMLILSIFIPSIVFAQPSGIKIYVQWALQNPRDWDTVDTSVWSSLLTKPDTSSDVLSDGTAIGDSLLNNTKGYVFMINVQGVLFAWYDHYAINNSTTDVTVTAWRDDPILFPIGHRQVDVGIFKPLTFDSRVGQINTDQSFILYREGTEYNSLVGNLPASTTLKYYSEFVAPSLSDIKHGIYVSDQKWNNEINAQTLHGWR